jgi:anti-sigma B factor antagonist
MDDYRRIGVSTLSGSAGHILVVDVLERRVSEPQVVRELSGELFRAIGDERSLQVVLDLSRVRHVSSSALNALIDLQDRLTAAGRKLRLCGLQPDVAEIFRITQLDRHFTIARDQTAALTSF